MKELVKKHWEELVTDELAVSILEFNDGTYELAVMYKLWSWSEWEIDYSIFKDVLTAESSMQVYGTIEYEIKPAYADVIYKEA